MSMNDYISEGEALSDILEEIDEYDSFEPCLDSEKRIYLTQKSKFETQAKGKFVIVQSPRRNRHLIKKLYLVDRNKTKRFWWSHDAHYAMLFSSLNAAKKVASKYVYNNVHVIKIK